MACFATLDTTTKAISTSVPLLMALWFRYFFQAVATTAVVLPLRGWRSLRTAHPKFQLLRGLLLLTSSLFAFLSLEYMPVAEFTSIEGIVPLAITLLAATALGESVSRLRWALIAGGFIGTLIIIRPGSEHFGWSALFPLVVVGRLTTNGINRHLGALLADLGLHPHHGSHTDAVFLYPDRLRHAGWLASFLPCAR